MKEALFITRHVMPWIRYCKKKKSPLSQIVFEAKVVSSKEKSINNGSFEQHQLPSLRKASSSSGITFKIPDGSGIKTPFDGVHISNAKAFIAIYFDLRGWCVIDIDTWDRRDKKNVTWEDCKLMAQCWYNKR